jgi:UDP-3-O-[3-hydroxymyristoyl] glucosamine N-acyltransferase
MRYEKAMQTSKAGVVFISPAITPLPGRNFLIAKNPSEAFQKTLEVLFGHFLTERSGFTGIHPTAVVHPTAKLGKNVTIGPHAVIDRNVTIGDDTSIEAQCYIGYEATIGSHTHLYAHVTIRERCHIGNRVVIQPGVVIGACGFGFLTDSKGKHTKLNQVGNVVIEDDVEIGANTTIDRSRFQSTVISRGTKIDNLVQIGHGTHIGPDNLIIAQVGMAGSTHTGANVVIAGQVAIAGHLTIADRTMIAGKSGVTKSLEKSGKYGGVPAVPIDEYNRNSVYLRNIQKYVKKINELEDRLKKLDHSKY